MRIAREVIAASPLRHYYFTVRARPVTNLFLIKLYYQTIFYSPIRFMEWDTNNLVVHFNDLH